MNDLIENTVPRSAIPLPHSHTTSENVVVGGEGGRKIWTAPKVRDLGPRSDAEVDTKASAGAASP
jgi:hypothetical protein